MMTMGILSIYFAIIFGYELTSIEQELNINPLPEALFFLCVSRS